MSFLNKVKEFAGFKHRFELVDNVDTRFNIYRDVKTDCLYIIIEEPPTEPGKQPKVCGMSPLLNPDGKPITHKEYLEKQ